MKMVEIKCPSCGGKLKVEDSQTKLITCEYCGSQFLLDDEKVQHITNYNIYQTTPSGKDQGNGAKIALGAGLACAGVLLAAFILSSGSGSSSGPRTAPPSIPAYTRPAGYLGKEGGSRGGSPGGGNGSKGRFAPVSCHDMGDVPKGTVGNQPGGPGRSQVS